MSALLLDLDSEYKHCSQRSLNSIFFGGGTPSLFSADSINTIIDHAKKLFRFEDVEITLEANPGTFEQEKFTGFRQAGVNRLSIGIQSFNATHLKTLGRIHDAEQALRAVETARTAGFDNINLDLMFGLPEQTIEHAVDDVTIATDFNVPHISHYQLTIEPNTFFHKHTPVLPDSDLLWEMQTQCQQILIDKNYNQYEISAYSQPDKQSKHNLNYWRFGDYIGIGAGAHGKLTEINYDAAVNKQSITRRWKHRQPEQYISHTLAGNSTSGEQKLPEQDIVIEFLLNALRLKTGSDIKTFEAHTGLDYQSLVDSLKNVDPELFAINKSQVTTTDKGYLFLNEILERLI